MSLEKYPSVEFVRQALRYEDGRLFWLVRPREQFATERAWTICNVRFSGKEAGLAMFNPKGGKFYWTVGIGKRLIRRHIIVWALHHGKWHIGLDHKNRDTLDDHIENLRIATQSDNNANCPARRNNTSGYKGVTWVARRGHWQAQISVRGRHINLGRFDDPAVAHEAYKRAAEKYFGEFACSG